MNRLKSIKLYFLSIYKLLLLNLKNFYFRSEFYNKKLITFIPDRIFYSPSTYLSNSLVAINNDFAISPKSSLKSSDPSPSSSSSSSSAYALGDNNMNKAKSISSKLDIFNIYNAPNSWAEFYHCVIR